MEHIFNDWRTLMACIQIWFSGGDPYGPFPDPLRPGGMVPTGWHAYPPPSLLIAMPFAFLPWPLSSLLILALSIIPFERWARQTTQRTALPWIILWLPLMQGIILGQTTLLFLVALLWAERFMTQGRDGRAGVLLALMMLKLQVGLLPAAWLLAVAIWKRRWHLPLSFALMSLLLWGGTALIAGPQIYLHWFAALDGYAKLLPNRPLIFPPFGPILAAMALLLWYRYGRTDIFGTTLLLHTLIYPLSVIYVASALAAVVIRWNVRWPIYPLVLSWLPTFFPLVQHTPDTIAAMTQAIVATGLLTALLPQLPGPWRKRIEQTS